MISVIIPLYNKETSVEQSIRSVLNQSFRYFELIIVDDGSTDNSLDVVRRIQDDRIVIIEQENGGPSKARNTGVRHARGKWIVFLDADDELLPDALSCLLLSKNANPQADIVTGGYSMIGEDEIIDVPCRRGVIKNNFKSLFYRDIFPRTGNSLYQRSLLLQHPFRESIRRYEDLEFILRALKSASVVAIPHHIFILHMPYSNASKALPLAEDDFVGHLVFNGKFFWERMCLYQLYLGERDYYPNEMKKLYPHLHRRYDLLLLYKILLLLRRFHLL